MTDYRSRVFIGFLAVGLVGVALVNMVVDRRALSEGGRELSWWSGLVLDVAVPVQKMVAVPLDLARGAWRDYEGVKLMPTFHPAYLLRNPPEKAKAWEDLKAVMRELGR